MVVFLVFLVFTRCLCGQSDTVSAGRELLSRHGVLEFRLGSLLFAFPWMTSEFRSSMDLAKPNERQATVR